jgi:hypothetical protein
MTTPVIVGLFVCFGVLWVGLAQILLVLRDILDELRGKR